MLKVFGTPQCDSVERALAWLAGSGIDHEFVHLSDSKLHISRIATWVNAFSAEALWNVDSPAFQRLPPSKRRWTTQRWIAEFALEPSLLRGPVFEWHDRPVMLGFEGGDALRDTLELSGADPRASS